jgi:hypothetical protein
LHGSHDVLDALLAPVLERVGELVPDLVAYYPRDADAAGLGQSLQPRGYIDPIAEDVVLLNDHVAEVHSDAECDAFVLGRFGIAFGHPALDLDSAAHRINHAWKFSEQAVAGILYRMAAVLLDLWLNELRQVHLQALVRSLLICSHQARIACHIGGEDCSKATDRGHVSPGDKLA